VKLVYLGTPDMAVPPLQAIVEAGHDVVLVVTRPDTRRGRGTTVSPSPVKAAASELGLPVTHTVDDVLDAGAELGVVVAFGQIIRPHVLAAMPMVNLHFSLLPRWRGAAPVERALLAGDEVTGVCLMAVEKGLDTGGVYARAEVPIGPETTAAELRHELVEVGTDLLVRALARPLEEWIGRPEPQQGEVTHAAKLAAADVEVDWDRPAAEIHRLIRVGGAWTTFRGKRLKITEARLVDGALRPVIVQPEGKAPMPFDAWRNGARPRPGELFGELP
jgi:methionyl-tRNA formyltransferase